MVLLSSLRFRHVVVFASVAPVVAERHCVVLLKPVGDEGYNFSQWSGGNCVRQKEWICGCSGDWQPRRPLGPGGVWKGQRNSSSVRLNIYFSRSLVKSTDSDQQTSTRLLINSNPELNVCAFFELWHNSFSISHTILMSHTLYWFIVYFAHISKLLILCSYICLYYAYEAVYFVLNNVCWCAHSTPLYTAHLCCGSSKAKMQKDCT